MKLHSLILAVVLLALAAPLSAWGAEPKSADWPTWRGPDRDDMSTETGLLKQWPQGGPELAWKMRGVGAGYSGVSISKGFIYTMGDGKEASYLYCLNVGNGKIAWWAKIGQPGGGGGYPGPRCTPTVDGDRVYVLGQFGDLVCLGAQGKEIWRKNLKNDFGGKMMSGWGYSESPLVDGDKLICTPGGSGGTVIALDKMTGQQVWRSSGVTDAAAYSSLVPVEFGSVRQYVQLTGDSVFAVAAADGKLLWRAERKGATAVITTPIFHDGTVFVTSGYNVGCHAFQVSGEKAAFKTQPLYASKDMTNHHGGVVLVGDHVYGFSDAKRALTCMELKTGKVAWENKSVGKGSVAYADGHLYVRSEKSGTVALVEAVPTGYNETGRMDQPERSNANAWPHPVICNGKMYLRDQNVLLCYNVKP